jgi:hypothetical protein
MKITTSTLRRIIQEEISSLSEEESTNVGKDIKGNTAADAASKKMSSNPALVSAMDKITTKDSLASFLQDVIKMASENGINQQEAIGAINRVLAAVKSSKSK